jgi:hypothetical protein
MLACTPQFLGLWLSRCARCTSFDIPPSPLLLGALPLPVPAHPHIPMVFPIRPHVRPESRVSDCPDAPPARLLVSRPHPPLSRALSLPVPAHPHLHTVNTSYPHIHLGFWVSGCPDAPAARLLVSRPHPRFHARSRSPYPLICTSPWTMHSTRTFTPAFGSQAVLARLLRLF